jgi:hypothetical protein
MIRDGEEAAMTVAFRMGNGRRAELTKTDLGASQRAPDGNSVDSTCLVEGASMERWFEMGDNGMRRYLTTRSWR